ncbi:hypothetical protein D3C85_881310 [compost metagenome]
MRIGLARHRIWQMRHPSRMQGRRPSREPRHRQIERAPEQLDGTALAQKPCAKQVEHPVHLHQSPPVVTRDLGVIDAKPLVQRKGRRLGHFVGRQVDAARHAQRAQGVLHLGVEVGDGPGFQHNPALASVADPDDQGPGDEVELHRKPDRAVRDQARRQPPRRNPQRHVPAVVQPGRLRQPRLADDLRPQLQRLHRRPQRRGRQFGPDAGVLLRGHQAAPCPSPSHKSDATRLLHRARVSRLTPTPPLPEAADRGGDVF